MQLEDERRHADQYKDQVEKVSSLLVKKIHCFTEFLKNVSKRFYHSNLPISYELATQHELFKVAVNFFGVVLTESCNIEKLSL